MGGTFPAERRGEEEHDVPGKTSQKIAFVRQRSTLLIKSTWCEQAEEIKQIFLGKSGRELVQSSSNNGEVEYVMATIPEERESEGFSH